MGGSGDAVAAEGLPERYRQRVLIDVIHDGEWIPDDFLTDGVGCPIEAGEIEPCYIAERDWGASLMAEQLTVALGLASYCRVNVARVLLDFGRFPGSTPRQANHLERFAINYPFSRRLSYLQKKDLLERFYDPISARFDELLEDILIKVAIHTYDRFNQSGTERPPVSIITRSIGYQTASELPVGLYDPLYPDILCEFTCHRILRDRISLTLEKANIAVEHNYPYCLPEGSLEVRFQVWAYFRYLRRAFESRHPETVEAPAYEMVWRMLQDTSLRRMESEVLRSYLHMYRRAPCGQDVIFAAAERAYEHISSFMRGQRPGMVDAYRFSPSRPSSLVIEVRKDIIHELDGAGRPLQPKVENVQRVAGKVAEAITTYLHEDRVHHPAAADELDRTDPWWMPPRK